MSTLGNCQLFLLNFAKLKNIIAQNDLETESKSFKAIDLKVKRFQMLNLHCVGYSFSLYTTFIQDRKI